MGKAAAFVCVILLGTFLIATAETVDEKESEDDDTETVLPPKATGRTDHDEREREKNKPAENVSPDNHNAVGTKTPKRKAGQGQGNQDSNNDNAEGTKARQRHGSKGGQKPGKEDGQRHGRNGGQRRRNEANTAENASSGDDNAEGTKAPQWKAVNIGADKNNKTMGSLTDVRENSTDLNEEVICEEPQAPEHGSVNLYDEPKVGSLAVYSCDPGRRLVGATTTQCLITGQWSFDTPQCLNSSVCASPPEIEGAITPTAEDTEYAVGMTATYSCNFGYVSRNSIHHISVCRINETTRIPEWTVPEITCIPRSCGDPGYVNNGQRIGNLFTFPNKVEYECEEGFTLRGLRARYCQAGGEWSGRLPTCEQIYCTAPSDPVDGRVTYSSLEYGTELRYECNAGFLLKKHQPRICSEDGSWSNEEPECTEARCEEPQAPEHGSVKLHGEPKVGSLATYSCDPDKRLLGAATTKCLITGQWTFDTPQCLSSCSVPYIENGEMGKIQTRTTTWRTYEEFKKVYVGEEVNSKETLFLRCRKGYLPADDSKFLESNQLEVTCSDGEWSKLLPCQKTSCTGHPPATKNGNPVIGNREHGYSIWYRCTNKNFVKVPGNVTCYFGKWIGIPPKCLNYPCNTTLLQQKPNYPSQQRYPGLIIPSQEYFESQEGFRIDCKNGFRKATTAKKIKCNRGSWDISENPCIDERDDEATSTTLPEKTSGGETPRPGGEVPHSVNVELPDNQNLHVDRNRGCFCTYDNENYFLKAQIGNKKLKRGDRVMRGETMSLECNHGSNALMWQNGFRYFGKANMTCSTCENWRSQDLPTCTNIRRSDTFIASPEDFKILPGGIIDLRKGESRRFFCVNTEVQPVWSYVEKWSVSYNRAQFQANGNVMFMEIMDIGRVANVHSGKYECFIRNHFGERIGSSFLELQVNDDTCPWFPPLIGLNVSYTDENKPESWATFSCASNAKLVGSRTSGCQYDGTWSATQPHCEYITCPWFLPRTGLNVSYSHENKPGSWATFSCASNAKLVGSRNSECQDDGTWSVTQPHCEASLISCPPIDGLGIFSIYYDNQRRINSTASFMCKESGKRVEGCSVITCLPNRTWSGSYPVCVDYVSCSRFSHSPELKVTYSRNVSVGSIATFSCTPSSKNLIGSSVSVCRENGSWSNPLPSCEESKCSVHDLSISVPEDVVPDMTGVNGEFLPSGSVVELKCSDNSIINGNSRALCGEHGKWEFGSFQCVPGCILNIDRSSHLLVQPVKDSYRLGEFLLLSCPPGERLSNDVERLMCLGGRWSDSMPDCKESEEKGQPGL